ncbi:hypothetical protein IWQ60_008849 [Tieghemiomyces parasiticus]|uniref:Mis6-domain-containing protein n=1 Tax=Tieghemiomyces parasiticus TaxID=78921 RepID=A0A9W7ZR75_9FUNG|nr:hypothetical protein IWQ60_008849 [Tieghemiomyces parasiticus]
MNADDPHDPPLDRDDAAERLAGLVQQLCSAPLHGRGTLIPELETYETLARQVGLTGLQILAILDLTLAPESPLYQAKVLMAHLYPRATVPHIAVCHILGHLARVRAYDYQKLLLHWVALIWDWLDDIEPLRRLYGVFFHYLSYESFRAPMVRILVRLTTRASVKPFRVRQLLVLLARTGPDLDLLELARVYKIYSPTVIQGLQAATGQIGRLPASNLRWQDTVAHIQARWATEPGEATPSSTGKVDRGTVTHRNRKASAGLPPVTHYYTHLHGQQRLPDPRGTPQLEMVRSFDEFARLIDCVELPDRLMAIWQNPYLHHLLACTPDPTLAARVDRWVEQYLTDLTQQRSTRFGHATELTSILTGLLQLSRVTRFLLPAVDRFLVAFLRTWNGQDHAETILELLTFKSPCAYEELYVWFLKPLHRLFRTAGAIERCRLLTTHTQLVAGWLTHRAASPGSSSPTVDTARSTLELMRHADRLAVTALLAHLDDSRVQSTVLDFYHLLTVARRKYQFPYLYLPFHRTFHLLILGTGVASTVAGALDVVAGCRQALDVIEGEPGAAANLPAAYQALGLPLDHVAHFNALLFDVCHCLWTQQAFRTVGRDPAVIDDGPFGLTPTFLEALRRQVGTSHLKPAVSIFNHPAFATYRDQFVRRCLSQGTAQPSVTGPGYSGGAFTSESFELIRQDLSPAHRQFKELRQAYLQFLVDQGFAGVRRFLQIGMPGTSKRVDRI